MQFSINFSWSSFFRSNISFVVPAFIFSLFQNEFTIEERASESKSMGNIPIEWLSVAPQQNDLKLYFFRMPTGKIIYYRKKEFQCDIHRAVIQAK